METKRAAKRGLKRGFRRLLPYPRHIPLCVKNASGAAVLSSSRAPSQVRVGWTLVLDPPRAHFMPTHRCFESTRTLSSIIVGRSPIPRAGIADRSLSYEPACRTAAVMACIHINTRGVCAQSPGMSKRAAGSNVVPELCMCRTGSVKLQDPRHCCSRSNGAGGWSSREGGTVRWGHKQHCLG
jgi:hypothetical protein